MPRCPQCLLEVTSGGQVCPRDGSELVFEDGPTSMRAVPVPPDTVDTAIEPTHKTDPLLGAQLGEYRILERIGEGGMGVVYRGVQPVIDKEVAIKVLRADLEDDPRQAERLIEEARAVNAIRSRSIVDIFGFGQLPGGSHYIVMELLHGKPLSDLIRECAPLSPYDVLDTLDEALAGLEAARQAGVVHRDLKPSNIFLVSGPAGERFVKLLDFGLSKRLATPKDGQSTLPGTVVGTPEYIAPEQATGGQVDSRADIYSLGVVAFEMLTGQLPFSDPSVMKMMMLHVNQPPPRPSSLAPGVPAPLEELVLQMLEKQPAARPSSPAAARLSVSRIRRQLAQAQTRLTSEVSLAAVPSVSASPPEESSPGASKRSRARFAAVLAGSVALIALAAGAVAFTREPAEPAAAPPAPVAAPVATVVPPKSDPPPPAPPPTREPPGPKSVAPKTRPPKAPRKPPSPEELRGALLRRIEARERQLRASAGRSGNVDPIAAALLDQLREEARTAKDAKALGRVSASLEDWQRRYLP